jgi:hypothetical protein
MSGMPMNDLGRTNISKPAAMGMPSDLPQARSVSGLQAKEFEREDAS